VNDDDGFEGGALADEARAVIPFYTEADAQAADNSLIHKQLTFRVDREKDNATQMFYYSKQGKEARTGSITNLGASVLADQSAERAIVRTDFDTDSHGKIIAQVNYRNENLLIPGLTDSYISKSSVELRHLYSWDSYQVVYGLTYNDSVSRFTGLPSLSSPQPVLELTSTRRQIISKGAFIQTEYNIGNSWAITAGTRYDDDSLSGSGWQPSVRFNKTFTSSSTLWGAISQTLRTPSRLQTDVVFQSFLPGLEGLQIVSVSGNEDLKPETALVGELGYRMSINARMSIDVTAFFHEIQNLAEQTIQSVQPFPGGVMIAQTFTSSAEAIYKGVEWALDWDFDRYSFGTHGAWSSMDFVFGDEALSVPAIGNAPVAAKYLLGSYLRWNVGDSWEFDLWAQYVSDVEGIDSRFGSDGFLRVDSRVAYVGVPKLTLALLVQDIGDSGDIEFRNYSYPFVPYDSLRMRPVYKLDLEYVF